MPEYNCREVLAMRKATASAILGIAVFTLTVPSFADKIKEDTTLKDNQPYGTKDKEHKHQAYDLSFDTKGKTYTCRTDPSHSMNAADFVVGGSIHVEIDNNKAKIKTRENKKVDCKIVRAEMLPATP
jgi:hypothetical protein